jgi:hypothetical protein
VNVSAYQSAYGLEPGPCALRTQAWRQSVAAQPAVRKRAAHRKGQGVQAPHKDEDCVIDLTDSTCGSTATGVDLRGAQACPGQAADALTWSGPQACSDARGKCDLCDAELAGAMLAGKKPLCGCAPKQVAASLAFLASACSKD